MPKKDHTNLFRLAPKDKEEAEEPAAESAGDLLKRERLNQGLSLEEVAAVTKISVRSLHALEENDQAAMPARTFVRGFIAIYARHLRLDPQELLARHAQQPDNRDGDSGEINAHAIIKLNPVAKNGSPSPYHLIAVLAAAATLLALLYWGYTYYFF